MTLPIHHLTLTVSNRDESAKWLQDLFGKADVRDREGQGYKRYVMRWPGGLWLGITEHENSVNGSKFSHLNIGMDHVGLLCENKAELENWVKKLDALDYEHGPIEEEPTYWAVTSRTPDNIPIEFYCFKET
ncbi:MAG TPA: VOC family protein [Candidatus Nanopelagicaceae bacterium]|nr:VOC family protein [Candidatus Nanopelagicaceae bacterium]